MHEFDSKDLKRLFGIPASQIRSLIRAGHIHPVKKAGRLCYSFQDLIVLRTAGTLRAAKIPAQKINRTLGGDILLIDKRGTEARATGAPQIEAPDGDAPEEHFEKALLLEETDVQAAQAAYEACLAANAQHVEARLNLGRLLHIDGRLREAEEVYRGAVSPEPLLLFNVAVLLEDLDREAEAMSTYREALALDPNFADAHFNLARLYERAGKPKDALRHLLAYRRLMDTQAPTP
jgi:tetratricopeptide (TPR) repeat protein